MAITDFHGANFFLSNFYEHPFWYHGRLWKSVEHAFQAAKCQIPAEADEIHDAETPGVAKRLGRKCTIIPGWDHRRDAVMKECIEMKFLTNDDLLEKLLATGTELLVEGNTWHDNYWGDCSCSRCAEKQGKNMLGRYLMEVRDNYRAGNYLWVARNSKNCMEIVECFKSRDSAMDWIAKQPKYGPECPYEANGYRLGVIKMR